MPDSIWQCLLEMAPRLTLRAVVRCANANTATLHNLASPTLAATMEQKRFFGLSKHQNKVVKLIKLPIASCSVLSSVPYTS